MSLDSLIEESRIMAYSGKDYMVIKKHMSLKAGSSEYLNLIMLKADEFIVEYQLAQQERDKSVNFILLGVFLFIFGLSLNIFKMIDNDNASVYLNGTILIGAYLIVKNVITLRKPIEDFIPNQQKIKTRKEL